MKGSSFLSFHGEPALIPMSAVFQGVLTFTVELAGLLPFSFQFCSCLAAVFAEEVGDLFIETSF